MAVWRSNTGGENEVALVSATNTQLDPKEVVNLHNFFTFYLGEGGEMQLK